jgi:hypothetical protein
MLSRKHFNAEKYKNKAGEKTGETRDFLHG